MTGWNTSRNGHGGFHYDSKNDPNESIDIMKERIALVGNINNPETLFSKEPETVKEEVYKNLKAGVHLVGPECAIPLQTSIENLKEISKAVVDWHSEAVSVHG